MPIRPANLLWIGNIPKLSQAEVLLELHGDDTKAAGILHLAHSPKKSGQKLGSRMVFTPSETVAIESAIADDAGATQHDPTLVGTWIGTRTDHAGDVVLLLNVRLELKPDGGFRETVVMGGNADDPSARVREEIWHQEKGMLEISPSASDNWLSLGAYHRRGDEFALIMPDGSAEVWNRY